MSEQEAPTYHDVRVICDGKEYWPSRDYSLWLMCTKAGGWSLHYRWGSSEQLIGEEFGAAPFRIEVKGMVIVDSTTRAHEDAATPDA